MQVSVVFAVVSQDYVARVHEIDVILGNAALLKCEIPSFVIDFVSVINWVDNEGAEHFITENTGIFLRTILKGMVLNTQANCYIVFAVVSQDYATRVNDFDVILGNSALLKCEIPSFVTDFVSVINWSDAEGQDFYQYQNNLGDQMVSKLMGHIYQFVGLEQFRILFCNLF